MLLATMIVDKERKQALLFINLIVIISLNVVPCPPVTSVICSVVVV
jgi:hypothetical protein